MLIRQTLLYLPAQILGPLVQFVAAIVWTHFLSAHEYGDLMIILASQELVFLVCLSWWTQYSMRYLAEISSGMAAKDLQSQENSILLASSFLQSVVTFTAVKLFVDSVSLQLVLLSVCFAVTRSLLTHIAERTRLHERVLDYTIIQMLGPILGTILGFVLLVNYGNGVSSALAGFVIAQFISLCIIWFRLELGAEFAWPSTSILKAAFAFGLPLLVAGGLAWFSVNGIRLIVEYFRGSTEVGLLSVGWGLGQRAVSVIAMLVTAASYPLALKFMNNGERDKAFEQVSLNGALLTGLVLPTVIGILLVGPIIVNLMIGTEFQKTTYVILPIAVVAAGLRNIRVHFLDQIFVLAEKPSMLLLISFVEVIATVLLCSLGLIFYGLAGAALGCLLGTVIGAVTCWLIARDLILKMPWIHFLNISIASSIMACVLYFTSFGEGYVALILKIAGGVSIYIGTNALLYWQKYFKYPVFFKKDI